MGEVAGVGEPARSGFARCFAHSWVHRATEDERNPTPNMRVEKRAGAIALLEADRAPGAVAMAMAMAEAMACAREVHVGWCAARNITHAGAVGYFALQAANAGMA